jgi:hypothetical protein
LGTIISHQTYCLGGNFSVHSDLVYLVSPYKKLPGNIPG